MAITTSEYNELKIERIYQILQNQERLGNASNYQIFVDTFKVVPRTNDLSLFETYANFVDANTQSITILIFDGNSNRNDKHIFRLQSEAPSTLNGVENIEEKIHKKLEEERQKWKQNQLERKHKKLKKAYSDLEKEKEQLERELAEAKSNKHKIGNLNMVEFGSEILGSLVKKNPQILNGLLGGEALAGAVENHQSPQETTYEEVTFSKKKKGGKKKKLSQEEKALMEFGKQLQERFNDEEMLLIMQLLDYLAKDKSLIKKILSNLIAKYQHNPQQQSYQSEKRQEPTSYNEGEATGDFQEEP